MKKLIKTLLTLMIAFSFIATVNAGSSKIGVSAPAQVIVGNTFTVTVTVSSSSPIGSWEYTLNYDKNIYQFVSSSIGVHYAGYASNANTKSVSYKYTFKALKSGTGKFYVDSSSVVGWDESIFSVTNGTASTKAISYADYQASLSKNNNLKGITVNDILVSEKFDPNTTEYNITVNEDVTKVNISATKEDSTATVNGTGEFDVEAGMNTFEIIVVAQNGSEKTYKVNVEVLDKNPIEVTVDNKKYTVVKLAKNLEKPSSYTETTVTLSGLDIPAFESDVTKFTLVGLKDENGEVGLFIYDDGDYTKYFEITSGSLTIYPQKMDKSISKYNKKELDISGNKIEVLTRDNKRFYIIKGINVESGEKGLFLYDKKDKSLIKYDEDYLKDINKTNIILIGVCGLFAFTTLVSLIIIMKLSKKKPIKVERVNIVEKEDNEINSIIEETKEDKDEEITDSKKGRKKSNKLK